MDFNAIIIGPHTALGNIPRSIEYAVDWVTDVIQFMQKHGCTYAEPTRAAVEGKQTRIIVRYSGSTPNLLQKANGVAEGKYRELVLD